MQIVDREAFSACVEDLQQTVGVDEPRPGIVAHTCLQGVILPLEMSVHKGFNGIPADPEEFCRMLKGAYIRNLFQISVNAMKELREIANTGKSDGLIQITQLLEASFCQQEGPAPGRCEETAGYDDEY